MSQAPITPSTDDKKPADVLICPCCKKAELSRPVRVEGSIVDDYMACILSGQDFKRTYKVYDGRIQVTVKSMSARMGDKIKDISIRLAILMQDADKVSIQKADDVITTLVRLLQIQKIELSISGVQRVCLVSATLIQRLGSAFADAKPQATVAARLAFLDSIIDLTLDTDTISAVPRPVLFRAVGQHNALYNLLLAQGYDQTFWEGIKLA